VVVKNCLRYLHQRKSFWTDEVVFAASNMSLPVLEFGSFS